MERQRVETLVRACAIQAAARICNEYYVPVAVSARHVHLSMADLSILFGKEYLLTEMKPLSQPGQFACRETVDFVGGKGRLEKVRILGPVRGETQLELSMTDCYRSGVSPKVRMSGDMEGTPGGLLIGPAGTVELKKGVLVAARHIHLSPEQADFFGLSDNEAVSLKKGGLRPMILEKVAVRVHRNFEMEVHIDTDEANACAISSGDLLQIVEKTGWAVK